MLPANKGSPSRENGNNPADSFPLLCEDHRITENSDVVLESTDKKLFYVHRAVISCFSDVLRDMFNSCCSKARKRDAKGRELLKMTDSSADLILLLGQVYHRTYDTHNPLGQECCRLLDIAAKYCVDSVFKQVQKTLRQYLSHRYPDMLSFQYQRVRFEDGHQLFEFIEGFLRIVKHNQQLGDCVRLMALYMGYFCSSGYQQVKFRSEGRKVLLNLSCKECGESEAFSGRFIDNYQNVICPTCKRFVTVYLQNYVHSHLLERIYRDVANEDPQLAEIMFEKNQQQQDAASDNGDEDITDEEQDDEDEEEEDDEEEDEELDGSDDSSGDEEGEIDD